MLLSRLAVLCIDRMMICQVIDNIGHCDLSFDLHSFPGCCRKLSQVLLLQLLWLNLVVQIAGLAATSDMDWSGRLCLLHCFRGGEEILCTKAGH
jgi:hypothetical protein